MKIPVKKPKCIACEHFYFQTGDEQAVKGVLLKSGVRYCLGKKRPRMFGKGDPKVYVPKWCPVTKHPYVVRVYTLNGWQNRFLHEALYRDGLDTPMSWRYRLCYEGTTEVSAQTLLQTLPEHILSDVAKRTVGQFDVLEIDDGHTPYYFYKKGTTVEVVRFDGAAARRNGGLE